MLYTGKFKNRINESIEVNIITGNDTTQTTELTFIDESPVIISQSSSDGLFSPIKSRSCTITIVSKDTYFDMFSINPHDVKVIVNNLGSGKCLFYGYMTPCQYNQPYAYLNTIELEAIDALSTLQDFKYEYVSNKQELHLKSIKDYVLKALVEIAGYSEVNVMLDINHPTPIDNSAELTPFENEYVNDLIFNDGVDKDSALNWYNVLEEIGRFYNCTFVPMGKDIYVIDYNLINISNNLEGNSHRGIDCVNLVDGHRFSLQTIELYKYIGANDYAGSDTNIEMEEIYNKITIEADIDEVDNDEMFTPIEDQNNLLSYWRYLYDVWGRMKDNVMTDYVYYVLQYTTDADKIDAKNLGFLYWTQYYNGNVDATTTQTGTKFTPGFDAVFDSMKYFNKFQYYRSDKFLLNSIPYQTAVPVKTFAYNYVSSPADVPPRKADWKDRIYFYTQMQWLYEYVNQIINDTTQPDPMGIRFQHGSETTEEKDAYFKAFWEGAWYNNYLGGKNPVLKFESPKEMQYSPTNSDYINYIYLKGALRYDLDHYTDNDDVTYETWYELHNPQTHEYTARTIPMTELGAPDVDCLTKQALVDSDFGQGWKMLRVRISIGDKYWNGNTWTRTPSTVDIGVHKSVDNQTEKLVWYGENKIVSTVSYKSGLQEEAYAIPMSVSDELYGKLTIEFFVPKIPYQSSMFVVDSSTNYYKFDYTRTPPVIYLEDFEVGFKNVNWEKGWRLTTSEDKDDEDIVYTNEVTTPYVKENTDLSLKINSPRLEKPFAESYIVTTDASDTDGYNILTNVPWTSFAGSDNWWTPNEEQYEEDNILKTYLKHYSSPKKIYNCCIHGYCDPFSAYKINALPTDSYMMVDEQEFDVKANTNEIKLIEF